MALERIAICTAGELFGGVERHILGLLSGLALRDVAVTLVLFYEGELAAQARILGIEPIIFSRRKLAALGNSVRLACILRQSRIRVVHVHGYKATVVCALARSWHSFALVKTEHGLPEPITGGAIRVWRDRLYHLLDRVATQMSNATVCYVTKDLRECFRRAHNGLQTTVIPNGLHNMNAKQFRRPPEMRHDWFNILMLGRLDFVKGHHLAIDALADKNTSPDVHLQILGEGPRMLELQALARARGISHRTHLLGFRRNVYEYIAHCDVILMPSLHEGLPYSLLEAMALGAPIIASRVGGLAEVLEDQTTGLLVAPLDAAAITSAIRRLQTSGALRAALGQAAQCVQKTRYSLDTMILNYIQVYQHPDLKRRNH